MQLTNTYEKRKGLTQTLEENLTLLFNDDEVELIPFGVENLNNNKSLLEYIKLPESNLSYSGMLIKFLPDYILLTKTSPVNLYFLEIKTSVTPLWSYKIVNEIKEKHKNINLSDIGIIAREAWNAYNKYFPNTIIIEGCSYNPNILLAQFVKDIKCLRCYDGKGKAGFNCLNCPLKNNSFFNIDRNYNSEGSQTPQTNINYSSFKDIISFFNDINIKINRNEVESLKNIFKEKGISFPSTVYVETKQRIINKLKNEGCYWL